VFQTPVNGLDNLKIRIRNVISAIPAHMLHRTWQELEYCLDVLRAIKGDQIEVYWINRKLQEFHYDLPKTACG
jgi:hypothetical protein